ncbi:helix-turn-helix domain-containing protein [Streptomyces spectabilis]|uniref:Transcriptional regulator with XRE-family HTH domain n=1 Tax=Streptomyces spectabilis TaxID=68270 RepID=A0A5P2X6E7_STRST|nr:helix-turn-helix transcriptional regulator [Streptomyces spectabilis]MBB5106791.1 transcriptional regulator with XRE-family HTH domain [Streptomyces spectabilis]MCI3903358.1 helix-turn-helix domain-containing protein [Streptomyces spectabilis]QEV60577.1 XRE family transcriptional regulator [Streptomyces spectabilis]GGV43848.1 transcriptional regulator [Streptomyces spectabilis]
MEDEEAAAVLKAVGRQVKAWREAAGMTQAELGAAIGYGDEMVSSVERGRRVPKPEFLEGADEVLGAGGKIAAMKKDVEEARYPKKVRDLKKLEEESVELGAYASHHIHGLLQTPEYAQALYAMRRPSYTEEEIERHVGARMARKSIFERVPRPLITFVQEEVTLRRPIGGRMVLRQQLEHLLGVSRLRHVEIQVMPTGCEDHAGMAGSLQLLKLRNGKTLGHTEAQLSNRLISESREVQIVEMRYGMIRAQALPPQESLVFIENVLGET